MECQIDAMQAREREDHRSEGTKRKECTRRQQCCLSCVLHAVVVVVILGLLLDVLGDKS